jgi:RNA polymerase sigma factor (sigma-70 family)
MIDGPSSFALPAATRFEPASESIEDSHTSTVDADAITRELAAAYDELAPGLLRYSMAISRDSDIASEGVQETFFRYFMYRRQGISIINGKAWLFRVLRNVTFDLLMKRPGEPNMDANSIDELPSGGPTVQNDLELSELKDRLPSLLSVREMECIQLRTEGFTHEEIASTLNLSTGGVSSTLSRATDKLRKALR